MTWTGGGITRRSLFFRPPGAVGPPPLVLMLHGTGGSAEFAADETGLAEFAAGHGFAVAFPDGLPVDPTSPARFLSNPKRWNDAATRPGDELHSDTDDVAFLAGLIDTLTGRGGADPERVYLAGFSNGAGMAFRFAAECGHRLAAVAPIAGYCHVAANPLPVPVPTLFVVGDSDLLIPLHGGPVRIPWGNGMSMRRPIGGTLAKWAGMLGCDPTPVPVADADGISEAVYPGPVEFVRVVVGGLGHHWPGGKGQFNPRIGGPVSNRLNANERLWAFFQRHRRASFSRPSRLSPTDTPPPRASH